ncbi:MAG TPA: hypothetical protein VM532_10685 [Burkholderiales bacterium]|nr:hypothetical protein [Burkholderiales bacterium]
MHKSFRITVVCLLSSLSGLAIANLPPAVEEKDPTAWYQEDLTPKAQYETAKKEAGAAYREALNDCREKRGAEKTACVKEAKAVYTQDLAEAKKLLGAS